MARVSAAVPEAARRRLDHVLAGRARSSLESMSGTAGLEAAGFDPVTEVMGCVVLHLGFAAPMCGYYGGGGVGGMVANSRTVVSGNDRMGQVPGGRAVDGAWSTALARLLAEVAAVDADGVVGITRTRRRLPGSVSDEEFVLLGTAVRARSATRPRTPFATDLSGAHFSALLRGGWIPAGFAIRVTQGIRHDDWATQSTMQRFTANAEVVGLTDLVTRTRDDARRGFTARMAKLGGEAAVVSSVGLRTWASEVAEGHRDHLAEATVTGTALVAFDRDAPARIGALLTILPLHGNAGERRGGRRR